MQTVMDVVDVAPDQPARRLSLEELSAQDTDRLLAPLYRSLAGTEGESGVEKGFNSSI
ncbi:hypothetical protein [Kitasatospora sp. LaBMicrA B282]|uniref:hypothetical protein n=1 Tax=Kitasatospora sp. LaBMicrA B282 TaxID=3420949 RepID=UPI003D0D034D